MIVGDKKEFYVGAVAEAKRGILKLNYPIEHGVVNIVLVNSLVYEYFVSSLN